MALSYKEKMKRLRPYVKFDVDLRNTLSTKDKRLISLYYNKLNDALPAKAVVYRPKKGENVRKAKAVTGLKGDQWKAYPIPSPTGQGRVKWRGDEVIIAKKGAFVRTIYPDQVELATDPRGYLDDLLDDSKTYIINSKNDWTIGGVKSAVIDEIESAMYRYAWAETVYDQEYDGDEPDDGSEYGEDAPKEHFQITIIEVDTRDRKTFREYQEARYGEAYKAKETARKARVRERSKSRRSGKRQYSRKGRGK